MSATVKPIEEVARYLSPAKPAIIVNTAHDRDIDLGVLMPRDELDLSHPMRWDKIYDRAAELILAHRTTLVL